jgi:hypothetical protein
MENYKTAIQSIVFLDNYPKSERYSFLKRHKIVPISKCITHQNEKKYCIIEPDKFKKLRTHRIKAFCNDSHVRYIEMIIGEY